ncbi:MAG: rhodanese-like domain-containing protein [Bacteroidota bacterium]
MSFKDINVAEFKELMSNEDTVILDVRTPEEEVEGVIPDARLINVMDPSFPEHIEQLDKDKSYLVFCRSGGRSVTACKFMSSKGFNSLYNLLGGIQAWNSAH